MIRNVAVVLPLALLVLPHPGLAGLTFKKLAVEIAVQPDGTYTQLFHAEAVASDGETARRMGQMPLAFNPSRERLDIVEAYTLKQDGTRKDVDAGAVKSQLPPAVRDAPMFTDVQEKVVIFPDLVANDTQVLTWRRQVLHPLFPGAFTWRNDFARNVAWEDARTTISAPASYALRTESVEVPFETHTDGDRVTYAWHYSAPAAPREQYAVAPVDRRPRLSASSFPSYDAMAEAYRALAAPKEAVTPAIQAKADEITSGVTDRRAQARTLYDWVSRRIRYVAIYLGRGAIEPHPAETVLANGYGDCKDHVVLLAALLKAKGIESRTVAINLGNAYTLSGPPTLAQLNHVITYLPEFDTYADSTLGAAAFGTLAILEYGKPIVMVGGAEGTALRRLPMPAADEMEMRTATSASLAADGTITGTTVTTGTGSAALTLRLVARAFQPHGQGARDMAEHQLAALGETGTGSFLMPDFESLGSKAVAVGNFTLEPQPGILDGDAFAPPVGLALFARPGDGLLGPPNSLSLAADEPTPCSPGRQVEELSLTVPPGRAPARLPAERRIEGAAFSYLSRWSLADNVVTVHRELTSRIDQPLCEGKLRQQAAEALRLIRRDRQSTVTLAPPAG
jgi:transglutaminase-like putative cysteine protease